LRVSPLPHLHGQGQCSQDSKDWKSGNFCSSPDATSTTSMGDFPVSCLNLSKERYLQMCQAVMSHSKSPSSHSSFLKSNKSNPFKTCL
jgi:hypothetical protein